MKLSITQDNLVRFGDNRYKKLRELGFEAIDFSNSHIVGHTCADEDFFPPILEEKRLIDEEGIEVYQVHGPWQYPPKDATEEQRAERLHKMQMSIEACALLGCKNWVIHPIMPFGCQDIPLQKEAETWELNINFFRKLAPTAHKFGVNICLENMPMRQFSIATPADILRLIDALDDDCFKMCLDVGHVAVFPDLDLAEEVHRVKHVLRAIHVHDNNGKADQHLFPYFGIVNWEAFGKALRDIRFAGTFSLEVHVPQKLPDPYFEETLHQLRRIASYIVEG